MDPPVGFPVAPAYEPLDVSRFPDLSQALDLARGDYNLALLQARHQRQMWAAANGQNIAGREARFIEEVAKQTTLAPLHAPFRVQHDAVFDKGPAFFMYGPKERIMDMVNGGGLRVSGGAEREELYQKGTFPRGVYATVVAPTRTDITSGVLSRFFFTNEYALANIPRPGEEQRPAYDVSHFVMFTPNANWTSSGYLKYRRAQPAFNKVDHWVMKSGAARGTIVGYDIIGYGRSRIRSSVEEMEVVDFTPRDHALVMNALTQSAEATQKATASDT